MKPAATIDRNFRTFLLVSQLEAKAIGARLQKARLESGMTQEQVADVATFSKRSLQDYEAGTTIPYKHMRELAGIYQCEVEWLLHGDPETTTPATPPAVGASEERIARLESDVAEALRILRRLEPPSEEEVA